MDNIKVKLDERGQGAFFIKENAAQLAEMVVRVEKNTLTVYHTEVAPEAEGKGLAKNLLATMVQYARDHQLKVIPLCPFVHAQFKRNPTAYADIWNNDLADRTID